MFSFQDHISNATKTQLEAQLALFTAFSSKAFESMEKVMDLNINVTKASLEESGASFQQLFSAKDPQEFLSLSAAQAQPNAEKALAYGRHLFSIASNAQAEFAKTAEEQISDTNRKVISLFEEVGKSGPPGSEGLFTLFRTAIGNANAGYEQFSKTAKQAADTFESNMNMAAAQFNQASPKSSSRASAQRNK